MKGATVHVFAGYRTWSTQGTTEVIPIITPNVIGAVAIEHPDRSRLHYHYDYERRTKTDSKGHYLLKIEKPLNKEYELWAWKNVGKKNLYGIPPRIKDHAEGLFFSDKVQTVSHNFVLIR